MQDLLEQLIDYLKGIWLKRRYIIVCTWLICPLGWFVVSQLDNVYESEARVYADTQSILRPLLKGMTVDTNVERQINTMVNTLLGRPNLERIIRMTDLDVQASTPEEYENIIQELKEEIVVKKTGGRRDKLFTITYENKDPELARNVVQSVLTVFIENTYGESRTGTGEAQKFIDDQIAEYENRLLVSEAKLTEFKQKYSDVLPNQYGDYYSQLNAAKERLKGIELQIKEFRTQLDTARTQMKATPNSTVDADNRIVSDTSIKTEYDDRISDLENMLDALQLKYTDKYPDVVEAKRKLENLNNLRSKEIKEYYDELTKEGDSIGTTSSNPVLQSLQIQINQFENQIASLSVRANQYRAEVLELESKIHTIPEIEAQLTALNRDYALYKSKYEDFSNRKLLAEIGQDADETSNNVNFRVIDPPRIPTEPTGPKRILFFIAVLIVGFGTGIGLSLLVSQINPVVTSASQITKLTGIPVFGVISATEKLGLQKWHRKKTIIFIMSNLTLLMILFAFIVFALFPEQIQSNLRRII